MEQYSFDQLPLRFQSFIKSLTIFKTC